MLVVDKGRNGFIKVIHYTSSMHMSRSSFELSSDSSSNDMVVKEEEVYLKKTVIERLEYRDGVVIYNPKQAISRGREKVGESSDDKCFKNAESFVNWLLTGKNVKEQEDLGVIVLAIAAAGAVLGLAIIGLVLLRTDSKETNSE